MSLIDLIHQIEPVTINNQPHIRFDDVVEAVANHLFPNGPQSEDDYYQVIRQAEQALANARMISAGEFRPPDVPFNKRGQYFTSLPEITQDAVAHYLEEHKDLSWDEPVYQTNAEFMARRLCRYAFRKDWDELAQDAREQLLLDVALHAEALGWQMKNGRHWTKPIPIDRPAVIKAINQRFAQHAGTPIYLYDLKSDAFKAAYGRYYSSDEPPQEIMQMINSAIQAHRYQPAADQPDYIDPIPPQLPDYDTIVAVLETIEPYTDPDTDTLCLPLSLVQQALSAHTSEPLTEWAIASSAKVGVIGQALAFLGYETDLFPMRQKDADGRITRVKTFRKEKITSITQTTQVLRLADGMTVHAPVIALDKDNETLVALQLVGPEQSVKANWAALMGGGKTHFINTCRVRLGGSSSHITLKGSLPCGWSEMWLIHKQASAEELNPELPVYILDDNTAVPPPSFFHMFDRATQLPLQESWSRDLWLLGRQANLIQPVTDHNSRGRGAWRIIPDFDRWSEIVSTALKDGRFTF